MTLGWRRHRRRGRRERGSASIFVIGMSLVLMVCAGLVVDGGLAINARMRIADDAEQAARIGADSINEQVLRDTGVLEIDEGKAAGRAAGYLQDRGYQLGEYEVYRQGEGLVVEIHDRSDTALLKLIDIDSYAINAQATATPETE